MIQYPYHSISDQTCPICFKTFAVSKYVKVHIDTVHRKLLAHSCRVCGKAFRQNSSRLRHERMNRCKVKRDESSLWNCGPKVYWLVLRAAMANEAWFIYSYYGTQICDPSSLMLATAVTFCHLVSWQLIFV